MSIRYSYRQYQGAASRAVLARASWCTGAVFNDVLAARRVRRSRWIRTGRPSRPYALLVAHSVPMRFHVSAIFVSAAVSRPDALAGSESQVVHELSATVAQPAHYFELSEYAFDLMINSSRRVSPLPGLMCRARTLSVHNASGLASPVLFRWCNRALCALLCRVHRLSDLTARLEPRQLPGNRSET